MAELHEVMQAAMGWTDSHLHEFDVGGIRYEQPGPDWDVGEVGHGAKAKLFRLAGQGDRLGYVYDFGDGWTHTLTVEKILAPEPGVRSPRCVSGRRACPPAGHPNLQPSSTRTDVRIIRISRGRRSVGEARRRTAANTVSPGTSAGIPAHSHPCSAIWNALLLETRRTATFNIRHPNEAQITF
ncbi:plasmid pRiA4b ORF-3 family protein [Pseudonocardia bannensis]|uniref:Plasmid pRiA4b ORF-3 family protein n=1 Tax=Pseudonocardia bannensis TaxID=630973 RepID=A0A848DKP5_9PSEU|nr:plasmid pRiA4b ORF-3 family protein [Pseudonocardia bannensis]NMH92994.1 plasmid pRiA4b ORF-3 family protein [Pseudonocardia bannensis]